jgi:Fibrobacter succinogenes major domain (Fib_succ_major).
MPSKFSFKSLLPLCGAAAFALLSACGDDGNSSSAENTSGNEEISSSVVLQSSDAMQSSDDMQSSSSLQSSSTEVSSDAATSNSSAVSSSAAVSSSSDVSSSAVAASGSLTDARDGQTYRTVTIGNQVWMAENLNFETNNSFCYDDSVSNCDAYGRLYLWSAAMDSAGVFSEDAKGCGAGEPCYARGSVRGVCPEGWHLPRKAEFETFFSVVGNMEIVGSKLKSTSGWHEEVDNHSVDNVNGSDDFGFTVLPAGGSDIERNYSGKGRGAGFWSSSGVDADSAYTVVIYNFLDCAFLENANKRETYSIRCVKD